MTQGSVVRQGENKRGEGREKERSGAVRSGHEREKGMVMGRYWPCVSRCRTHQVQFRTGRSMWGKAGLRRVPGVGNNDEGPTVMSWTL
jgi:hypothetical protein